MTEINNFEIKKLNEYEEYINLEVNNILEKFKNSKLIKYTKFKNVSIKMDKNFIFEMLIYFKNKKYEMLIEKLSFLFLEFFNNNNEEYINEFIKLDENKECNSYDENNLIHFIYEIFDEFFIKIDKVKHGFIISLQDIITINNKNIKLAILPKDSKYYSKELFEFKILLKSKNIDYIEYDEEIKEDEVIIFDEKNKKNNLCTEEYAYGFDLNE